MARNLVINKENHNQAIKTVWQWILEALAGGEIELTFSRPSRSRLQEKHYHALINEIVRHSNKHSTTKSTLEGWKALMVYEFEKEKAHIGEPLRNRGYYVLASDGERVHVRPSTTKFSKKEGQEFIEFLYAKGVEYGVVWSATAQQIKSAEGLGYG